MQLHAATSTAPDLFDELLFDTALLAYRKKNTQTDTKTLPKTTARHLIKKLILIVGLTNQ